MLNHAQSLYMICMSKLGIWIGDASECSVYMSKVVTGLTELTSVTM